MNIADILNVEPCADCGGLFEKDKLEETPESFQKYCRHCRADRSKEELLNQEAKP